MDKENVKEIGSRLELFVDLWLIEKMTGANLELHHPVPREVVMTFDRPWEGNTSFYTTIFRDKDRVRMFYRGSHTIDGLAKGDYGTDQVLCYAESENGITWHRPNLDIYEWEGSKENNIIMSTQYGDDFCPFKDGNPAAPDSERYKGVCGLMDCGLSGFVSADAVHWRRIEDGPIMTDERGYDWTQCIFWDDLKKEYVAFLRGWEKPGGGEVMNLKLTPAKKRIRHIRHTQSKDFRTWSEPKLIELDVPLSTEEQFYTNAIQPYCRAPHIYIGTPKRYMPRRTKNFDQPETGLSDGALIVSRDGHYFKRWCEGFIRPGQDIMNWVQRNNYPTRGMLETTPGEISLYWIQHYHQTGPSCLRRGTLRTDGFVSVNAGYNGGELLTKPIVFKGSELAVNYSTSAFGNMQVEIQDESGKAIDGYRMDQFPMLYGDEIEHVVSWEDGPDVSRLAGQPVRLRFSLKDADLYSIRFQ